MVERLFADPQPDGQVGGPCALGAGILEDAQVGRVEVREAAFVAMLSMCRWTASQSMRSSTDQRRWVMLLSWKIWSSDLTSCADSCRSSHAGFKETTMTTREEIRVGEMVIRFVLEGDESGGSVAVFEFDVPAGAKVATAHSHDGYDETIYGLVGTLTWTLGVPVDVGPGDALFTPRSNPSLRQQARR